MKKVLFSFFLFTVMAVGVNAQKSSCAKACTAKPASAAACESKSSTASTSNEAAAKLASMDASIETRTCPVTGTVSYVKKETTKKGEVSYVDVNYDATTNTFVNVSPSKMEGGAGCGPKNVSGSGKSCSSAKSASGAPACCAGKGKTAKSASAEGNNEKQVAPSKG